MKQHHIEWNGDAFDSYYSKIKTDHIRVACCIGVGEKPNHRQYIFFKLPGEQHDWPVTKMVHADSAEHLIKVIRHYTDYYVLKTEQGEKFTRDTPIYLIVYRDKEQQDSTTNEVREYDFANNEDLMLFVLLESDYFA